MPDIVSTWGLDWSDFRKGSSEVESAAERSAKAIERSHRATEHNVEKLSKLALGFGVMEAGRKIVEFAGESMEEYGKYNVEAGARAKSLGSAIEPLKIGLGRDLTNALEGSNDGLHGLTEGFEKARTAVVNFYSDSMKLWGNVFTGHFGDALDSIGSSARIDKEHKAQEEMIRRTAVMKEDWANKASIDALRVRAEGTPEAEARAQMIEELGRYKIALADINSLENQGKWQLDPEAKSHAIEHQNALQDATIERINREFSAAKASQTLQSTLLEIDLHRTEVADLRLQHQDVEAARLDVQLQKQAALAQLEARRASMKPQDFSSAYIDTAMKFNNMEATAVMAAETQARDAHQRSQEQIQSGIDANHLQEMRLAGDQAAAELLEVRLETERQIRDVMRDQNLTADEQSDAADRIRSSREKLLGATAHHLEDQAREDYTQSLGAPRYRSLASGLASDWTERAVFGPDGASTVGGMGSKEVQGKFDLFIKAQNAANEALAEIARNTRNGTVAVVGP